MSNMSRRTFMKNAILMSAGMTTLSSVLVPKMWAATSDEDLSSFLLLMPYLGKPTHASITMNLVAGDKDIICYAKYRMNDQSPAKPWHRTKDIHLDAFSAVDLQLTGLRPGTRYQYELYACLGDGKDFQKVIGETFITQKSDPAAFSFAVFSDAHITPFDKDRSEILTQTSASVLSRRPDFAFMLGDNIQTFTSHGGPMTEPRFGPILYAQLRHGMGPLPSAVPVFKVLGNWEGENGWHPARERSWAREARMAFIPNPGAETYPEGGNEDEDYYAFTWGDVLFVALNVTGYTLSDHTMQSPVGKPDDWTLGDKQKAWLFETLSESKAKWKLLFIHHTVGGNAGDDVNSRYGRGGGRAAKTGEQALIHRWMQQFSVQALFYGHDHVFTDIPVDGIHYICVGSAGAPWKFPTSVTGYEKYWTPSGYTWVDVEKDRLKITFLEPDPVVPEGKVMHRFDIVSK